MSNNHNKGSMLNIIIVVCVGLFLIGLGFGGGVLYQKNQQPKVAITTNGQSEQVSPLAGRGGRTFGGQRPTIGSVTAISPTSITVKDQISNSDKTLSITSSTTVTDNGQTVNISDIKVGDTALIRVNASSSSTADRITLNPSFGGPAGAPSSSQSQSN